MATRQVEFLQREGWIMTQRKKMGCMWIVRWTKPGTTYQWSQGQAYQMAMNDKKRRKQNHATGE